MARQRRLPDIGATPVNALARSPSDLYGDFRMTVKRKPHHDLVAIRTKFATTDTLEITRTALGHARAIGFALDDVVDVVQALEPSDFVKSETAHNPPNSRIWHDTYQIFFDGLELYLKFAGETLVDVVLVSFKEK